MAKKKITKKTSKKTSKKATKKTTVKSSKKKTTAKKTKVKSSKKTIKTKKTTSKKITKAKKTSKAKKNTIKPVEEKLEEKTVTIEEQKAKDEKERIESYKKAGEIAKKVKEYIRPKIKVGVKLLDLTNDAEDKIIELGGKAGFPVNISINHIAAHYSSPPGDKTEIIDGDIVKFDFGVHIEGYCVDNAFTVSFNKEESLKNLIKAAEDGVSTAIKLMKPGMKTNHIGAQIEKVVKGYGYKPIKDLTGHSISRWDIHGGKSIPCVATPPGTGQTIEEGEIFAIEVFTSNGEGTVHAQHTVHIYQLNPHVRKIALRKKPSRAILNYLVNEFQTLPFSKLQITRQFPKGIVGLIEIIKSKKLIEHNILSEKKGRGIYVAQKEETVLITKDGCEILT